MSSFFSRIQGYFGSENTGRYIGIILLEIINEDPSVLNCLFGKNVALEKNVKEKKWKPVIEWAFSASKKRRADLAIVNVEDESECFALLEVKAEDNELPNQYKDYLDYVKKQKHHKRTVEFTVFSKYFDAGNIGSKNSASDRFRSITYSKLAQTLIDENSDRHPAVNLFIDYVKDMGLMFNNINQEALRILLVRLFHEKKGKGRIRSEKNIREIIPTTFSSVISNQYVLSEQLSKKFESYSSTVDFSTDFVLDKSKNKKTDDGDFLVKVGGVLNTYTSVKLNVSASSNDWLYLYYGLTYEISEKDPKKIMLHAYATISGKQLKQIASDDSDIIEVAGNSIAFSTNYKPDKLQRLIENRVHAVLQEALKTPGMPASYIKELKKLPF